MSKAKRTKVERRERFAVDDFLARVYAQLAQSFGATDRLGYFNPEEPEQYILFARAGHDSRPVFDHSAVEVTVMDGEEVVENNGDSEGCLIYRITIDTSEI